MLGARVSGLCAVTTAMVVLLGACSGGDKPSADPRPTDLPQAVPGRLVRLLGDGTWDVLDRSGPARTSSVNRPAGLAVAADGTLLGLQGTASFPGLIQITPSGRAAPVAGASSSADGPQRGEPVA